VPAGAAVPASAGAVSEENIGMIVSMGFSVAQATHALKETVRLLSSAVQRWGVVCEPC